MNPLASLWSFLTDAWVWFWVDPLTRLIGTSFVVYFLLKPFIAAIQFFRQVGRETEVGGIYTRGRAFSTTTMRFMSDYGSAVLWTVMWITSARWLAGIGLNQQIPYVIVCTLGMAIYITLLYLMSGASIIVMITEFLDDGGGLGSLIAGIWILSTPDSLDLVASVLIEAIKTLLA